jgi:tRNA(fMet)-specific endonuclease VapC
VAVRLLLDTNAYSAWLRGRSEMKDLLHAAQAIYMSTFVVGELLVGFREGSRLESNWQDLQRLLAEPRVRLLPATFLTADRYSRIVCALRAKGRQIPTNDVWIAAHAMEVGADLVSYDRHFGEIDGLAWVQPGRR